jgi:transcriptional regulator with XRE-family HTH domain
MNMIIAKLKEQKIKMGLSNKELSTLSGVPYGTVCRVMSKMDGTPNLQTLKDLSKALNVSIDDAIGLEEGTHTGKKLDEETSVEQQEITHEEETINPRVMASIIHSYEALLEERSKIIDMKNQALKYMEKWLMRLFIACCILACAIIAILAFDLLNPSVGFFQR